MSNDPSADATLSCLIDAALAGARVVMTVYGTDFSVSHKVDDTPVSEADIGSEAAIREVLAASLAGIPVVGEEGMANGGTAETGPRFLLVDPLDGTREFISRNGEFTVNIALIEDEAPVSGVLLAPALSLAYAATRSAAWKGTIDPAFETIGEWTRLAVRPAGDNPLAVASRSHMNPATSTALAQAGCVEHRSIGSSLKFGLIAEGEADLYPRLGPTMEWDTAAGDAVLRAAGGFVATLDGQPLRYGKRDNGKMRPFENPFFVAAGDQALLKRLDFGSLT